MAAKGLLMPDFLSLYVNAYYYLECGKSIFMNIFGEEVIGVRLHVHSRQTVLQSVWNSSLIKSHQFSVDFSLEKQHYVSSIYATTIYCK